MANNQEMYCVHCRENTLFFLESDLLWHCDECGNVYGSIPADEDFEDEESWDEDFEDEESEDEDYADEDFWDEDFEDEELWDGDIGEVIKCRYCNNLVAVDDLVDGYLCPICFDDLSGELEDFDEE